MHLQAHFVQKGDQVYLDAAIAGEDGKLKKSREEYTVQKSRPFLPTDIDSFERDVFKSVLDLEGFDSGVEFRLLTNGTSEKTVIFLFNYNQDQKALLFMVGGWPIPFGKTEGCH